MGTVKKKAKSRYTEIKHNGVTYVVDWESFRKMQEHHEKIEKEAFKRGFR